MEKTISVLMTCPMDSYLETQLDRRFSLLRLWTSDNPAAFIAAKSSVIRAVVGNFSVGVSKEMIEALLKLEIVANFSVGLDKVDLEKCRERGVRVSNTPDVLTEDVADLAIGLVLAVLRRLSESDRYVRGGFWKKGDFKLTTKFTGKRVGILGLGRIGLAIAKRAEAFNCPISYHTRREKSGTAYTYYPSVLELASNCDILIVVCPLTEQTYHIINH